MAQAARDQNRVTAALGSYNGSPVALKVDHTTGYLKAVVTTDVLSTPSVNIERALRDGNFVTSALLSYNGTPKPMLIQHSSGKIRASLQ